MSDAAEQPAAGKFRRRRWPPLKTSRHVERELARLYHDLREGLVTPEVAGTGGRILNWITRAREVGELEERLQLLEAEVDHEKT